MLLLFEPVRAHQRSDRRTREYKTSLDDGFYCVATTSNECAASATGHVTQVFSQKNAETSEFFLHGATCKKRGPGGGIQRLESRSASNAPPARRFMVNPGPAPSRASHVPVCCGRRTCPRPACSWRCPQRASRPRFCCGSELARPCLKLPTFAGRPQFRHCSLRLRQSL